jgi:hypothetical protein
MNERTPIIKQAQREARKLKRPWSVSHAKWAVVQDVLIELASHVPDVRPSQEKLAKDLGTYRAAVRRALDVAEAHGFIERRPYEGYHGHWDATEYRLLWWSGHTPLSSTSHHITVAQSEPRTVAHAEPGTVAQSEPLNGVPSVPRAGGIPPESTSAGLPPPTSGPEESSLPNLYPGACVKCGRDLGRGDGRRGAPGSSPWCHECAEGKPSTTTGDRRLDKILREREETERSMREYVPPQYRDPDSVRL